jgi:hypothetical protein
MAIFFSSFQNSYSSPVNEEVSFETEHSYLLSWLAQVESCTKSASAESLATLQELARSGVLFETHPSEELQNLISKVRQTVENKIYDSHLHVEAERLYLNILSQQDDEYNLSFWEAHQGPGTPQRASPAFPARRHLFS